MEKLINEHLIMKENAGLLRTLSRVDRNDVYLDHDGRKYINFSSNDYLGLSTHPELIEASIAGLKQGVGTSASRLMTGSTEEHHLLEEEIASFKGKSSALVFNSGYQANVGVISAVCTRKDVIFQDKYSHASIVDGALLSGAKVVRFKHNDMEHLEYLISKERDNHEGSLIITESIFSMDGDKAPLEELVRIKEKYSSLLYVDEAHATGIFGRNGAGMAQETGTSEACDFLMGTFSKALGSFGAYVATSDLMRKFLVNSCRSFIYSTSLPVSIIKVDRAALAVIRKEPNRRKELLKRSALLRKGLNGAGLKTTGESQIIPVMIGENDLTLKICDMLKEKGFWVTPVRPPTVPDGTSRLRISVTYNHTNEMMVDLIEVFEEILKTI